MSSSQDDTQKTISCECQTNAVAVHKSAQSIIQIFQLYRSMSHRSKSYRSISHRYSIYLSRRLRCCGSIMLSSNFLPVQYLHVSNSQDNGCEGILQNIAKHESEIIINNKFKNRTVMISAHFFAFPVCRYNTLINITNILFSSNLK